MQLIRVSDWNRLKSVHGSDADGLGKFVRSSMRERLKRDILTAYARSRNDPTHTLNGLAYMYPSVLGYCLPDDHIHGDEFRKRMIWDYTGFVDVNEIDRFAVRRFFPAGKSFDLMREQSEIVGNWYHPDADLVITGMQIVPPTLDRAGDDLIAEAEFRGIPVMDVAEFDRMMSFAIKKMIMPRQALYAWILGEDEYHDIQAGIIGYQRPWI